MGQNLFSDMVNLNKAPKPVLEKQSSERRVLPQNSFQEEVKKEEHEANLKKRFFNQNIWEDFYEQIKKFEVKDIPIDNLEDDKEEIVYAAKKSYFTWPLLIISIIYSVGQLFFELKQMKDNIKEYFGS